MDFFEETVMIIKRFRTLPDEARKLREEVFIKEQGFENEFDELDSTASHLVMYDDDKAVAVCRFFYSEDKGCCIIGRVAVSKEYRGQKLGAKIMLEAERLIKEDGGTRIGVSAQCQAAKFYESLGYTKASEEYLDEHCPHVFMVKSL